MIQGAYIIMSTDTITKGDRRYSEGASTTILDLSNRRHIWGHAVLYGMCT
jgi:hypothetical protein